LADNEQVPNQGTPIEGEGGNSSQQPNAIENKAKEMGWRPLEEFNGNPEEFIDAGEFVRRKPLFDKIENTTKQLKNVSKSLEYLKDHYQKVKATEYQNALSDLKAQLKTAKKEGNHELTVDIEDAVERVEGERDKFLQEVEAIKVEPEANPQFVKWVEKNNWYTSTSYMRSFADELGTKLHKDGMTPADVLVEVEKAVKKEFPDKFRNANRDTAPSIEGSSSRPGQRKTNALDTSFMNEQDIRVMNQLVRDKVLTKEEYIADMKLQYGVK
jgi:regulator of replication initiation timing